MASFGENLKRERELRGVDLHDMAEATKISIRFLQALEQDRVDVLPGGLFPRAFVRQYAKYLGLDPDRLVTEFVHAHGGDPAAQAGPVLPVRPRVEEMPMLDARRIAVGALVLLLLAFAVWQGLRGGRGGGATAALPAPTPVLATPFPEDRVYPPPTVAGAPQQAGVFAVTITARRNSWVDVKADGVTVINRVMGPGESQRIEAREQIGLSAGNAGGVEYALEGRGSALLGREGEVRRNVLFTPESIRAGGPVPQPSGLRSPRPRPASPSVEPTAPAGEAPSATAPAPPSPSPAAR